MRDAALLLIPRVGFLPWHDAGRQLGNTPQAFSHVGPVNPALHLSTSSALEP